MAAEPTTTETIESCHDRGKIGRRAMKMKFCRVGDEAVIIRSDAEANHCGEYMAATTGLSHSRLPNQPQWPQS
jgi:hypothetical protein